MGIALAVALAIAAGAEPAPTLPDDFLLIAHRGVTEEGFVENSLAATEETIARGYTHMEVDLRATKDGHAVCLHDPSLWRTTGVDRLISDVTLEELRELVDEVTVPSFETFCARVAGRIGVMPDVKRVSAELKPLFFDSIEASLERHGLMESALFIGDLLMKGRALGRAKVSWQGSPVRASGNADKDPRFARNHFVFVHADAIDREQVETYQALGMIVVVSINLFHYTDGDPVAEGLQDVDAMLALGVDGLQIDSVYDLPIRARMPQSALAL